MPSIFSRIIAGEIPCYKVAEDDAHIAILDISPLTRGHTLVIPKREVDYLFDIADEEYIALMAFSKRVAVAIGAAIPCLRVGVAVIGLEVPHAHIHLIPLHSGTINFNDPKLSLSKAEMEAIAEGILQRF